MPNLRVALRDVTQKKQFTNAGGPTGPCLDARYTYDPCGRAGRVSADLNERVTSFCSSMSAITIRRGLVMFPVSKVLSRCAICFNSMSTDVPSLQHTCALARCDIHRCQAITWMLPRGVCNGRSSRLTGLIIRPTRYTHLLTPISSRCQKVLGNDRRFHNGCLGERRGLE